MPKVRLIGADGEQVGIVSTDDAREMAREAELDLVEVAPGAKPPVARLLDYSKYRYEQEQKLKQARKHQTQVNVREIKLRPKIAVHDYNTKKGHVTRFLKHGDKVKVTIMFRGREQSRPEMGVRLLQRLAEDVAELGFVESMPKQDGRNMTMVLGPVKKKAEAAGWKGNELDVNADIIVLANPEIALLPNWVIALVAAGGLAAALSTAAGLLMAISSAVSHDLVKGIFAPDISEKNELLPHLSSVVSLLSGAISDPWTIALWLNSKRPELNHRTPQELMRGDESAVHLVLQLAEEDARTRTAA